MTETTVLSATAGARSLSVKERAPEIARPEVTTADVLNRAADLLEEFGWLQHNLGGKAVGGFCALGALLEASHDLGLGVSLADSDAGSGAWAVFSRLGDIEWNNDPGRTKAEVVSLFRETATAQAVAPKDSARPAPKPERKDG